MGFVNILNEAVKGKKLSDDIPASPIVDKLVKLIEKLSRWVDETPAIDQPQRFGNKAFRTWWEKIRDVSLTHKHFICDCKAWGGGGGGGRGEAAQVQYTATCTNTVCVAQVQ